LVLPTTLKDKQWLIGFAEGEGSFLIVTQKHKDKTSVSLKFTLTQHAASSPLIPQGKGGGER
jgi:hypothetical protein